MNAWWQWWLLPLSGHGEHSLPPALYWHARLMVLAWGVLVPLGALVARYFKVLPGQNWPARLDSKLWWHSHRALQWLGLVVATAGLLMVLPNGTQGAGAGHFHGAMGWTLMGLGLLQLLSGLVRGSKGGPQEPELRGDHYDMTAHRIWFERVHKSLGWLLIVLAMATIMAGLWAADAPRWMPALLALWWLCLVSLMQHWQAQGRCIDTYQAIWGPDRSHPGNQRPPIGWGIRRPWETRRG